MSTGKGTSLDTNLTPHTEVQLETDRDSHVSAGAVRILDENRGGNPCDLSLVNDFLERTPKSRENNT